MKMKPIEMKGATKARTHRETADEYANVILRRGRYRVAVCRDGLQWLFQKCVTKEHCAGARWRTFGYCTTREALMRVQHSFVGRAWPELAMFPERFKRRHWQ